MVEFILYVKDQGRARDFYSELLGASPILDVPGMTEFYLGDGVKLGLMPETGIRKIIGDSLPDPALGNGIPRAELYLTVDDAESVLQKGVKAGARLISPLSKRSWGDEVGYLADLDGHILAFKQA